MCGKCAAPEIVEISLLGIAFPRRSMMACSTFGLSVPWIRSVGADILDASSLPNTGTSAVNSPTVLSFSFTIVRTGSGNLSECSMPIHDAVKIVSERGIEISPAESVERGVQ